MKDKLVELITVGFSKVLTGNDDSRKNAEKAMLTWLKQPAKEET